MRVCHVLLMMMVVQAGVTRSARSEDAVPGSVRVMSFNIRYGSSDDGENHWDHRKDFVADTIQAFNPDLLGTQETLKFQRDFLAKKLPEYEVLGVGRDDGQDRGEMMALFYRTSRFEKLEDGHFWLSETPDVVGSISWDSSLPRMVTWVKLNDRMQSDLPPIVFFNTHFDHRGPEARRQSAVLLRERARQASENCRVILTGDFNAAVDSPPYLALFSDADNQSSPVCDAFRNCHPETLPNENTFSAFRISEMAGARIDWIAVSRDWTILNADIDRTHRDGRTPSDHFPVTATLQSTE